VPKILKTKGICLSSRETRETSKLTNFYTEKLGKVAFVGKGARNPKSKFGSALEIFSLSELIFYRSESKAVYTLSDAAIINDFQNLKHSNKFLYANQIIELPLRAVNFEDPNPQLFDLLNLALQVLNQTSAKKTEHYSSLLGAYFLKAISLLGYKPELNNCTICNNEKIVHFSIEHGGAICSDPKHIKADSLYGLEQVKTMRYLLTNPLSKSMRLSTSQTTLKAIQDYITYHLEKVKLHSFDFTPSN
jgi:DNA repair protein RecO (recombination protein O)